jgi:O-acetyl-ADP-ribose deacetylase (regulator of RNase III)
MKIIFFDFNNEVIDALKEEYKNYENIINFDINFENSSLLEIKDKYNNYILVSPANSFGSMGGGIDYYINKFVFPDIEILVQDEINKLDNIYKNNCFFDNKQWKNHKYLPVGQSLMIKFNENYLAVVPTMIYPQDISNTDNVYYAMKSLMELIKNYQVDYLLIPGLGTGIGGLDYKKMASQIFKVLKI